MTNGVRVFPRDVVESSSCITGAREWIKLNGLSFREFIKEGLPVETVRAINCPLGNRACDVAEKRACDVAEKRALGSEE